MQWVAVFVSVFIILVIVMVSLISNHDKNRYVTEQYEIFDERVQGDVRFVMLSDLHNKDYGNQNDSLLKEIDRIHPDFILMAGDMMTARKGESFQNATHLVKKLASRYCIYYGMGNHEHRAGLYPEQYGSLQKEYFDSISDRNVHILNNTGITLKQYGIRIIGLTLNRMYYKRIFKTYMSPEYISKEVGESDKKLYTILIAHNPQYFNEYSDWGAPLILSGHIHGGVVRLPFLGGMASPAIQFFPKYDAGRFENKSSTMIISRGLGTHTIPIRMWNPGEISVITIHGSKQEK